MTTAVGARSSGLAAISRAVVSAAADLAASVERAVVGDDRVRTARGNAYAAICADRARAQARDEMDAMVRTLLADGTRTAVHPAPRSARRTDVRPASRSADRTELRSAARAANRTEVRPASRVTGRDAVRRGRQARSARAGTLVAAGSASGR